MKINLCLLLIGLASFKSFCQKFEVNYTVTSRDLNGNIVQAWEEKGKDGGVGLLFASGTYRPFPLTGPTSSGSIEISQLPSQLRIGAWRLANAAAACESQENVVNLSSVGNCYSFLYEKIACSGTVTIGFSIKPILTAILAPVGGNYCSDQSFSLTGTSGFSSYRWQYRISGGAWSSNIPGATTNQLNVSLAGLFGRDFYPYLNKAINFRMFVDGCDPTISSVETSSYTFYAAAPTVSAVSANPPTCPSGNDGSIQITLGQTISGVMYHYSVTQFALKLPGQTCPATSINGKDYCTGLIAYFESPNSTYTLNNGGKFGNDIHFAFAAGLYRIKIESSANVGVISCFTTHDVEILPPPALSIGATIGVSPTPPSCVGGNDGSASFTLANSRSSYNWAVTGASTFTGGPHNADVTTLTLNSFSSGNSTVRVTDGCGQQASIVVSVPATSTQLQINKTEFDPTCGNNGSITFSVNGVGGYTENYKYDLVNISDPSNHILIASIPSGSTSGQFAELSDVLTYRITATSPNKCQATNDVDLEPPPAITGDITAVDAKCYGGSDGKLIFTKSSGSTMLSFTVGSDSKAPDLITGNQYEFVGYGASSYTLKATDNCLTNTGAAVNFIAADVAVSAPANPLSYIIDNPSYVIDGTELLVECAEGTITVSAAIQNQVGSARLSFYRDGQPIENGDNVTPFNFVNLQKGNYQLSVQDDCSIAEISFSISAPDEPLTAGIETALLNSPYHLACAESRNGVINLRLSGGVQGTGSAPKYHVEFLDPRGDVLIDNIIGPNSSGFSIVQGLPQGNEVPYIISGLSADVAYQLRVSDFNTQPGPCVRLFTTDNNGMPLSLSAPLPLSFTGVDEESF
jgi:hypothetical protein